jgi:plastocyanin
MSKPHAVSLLRPTHFLLLLCLLAVFGVAQAATVKPTKLVAEVGPGFTITLKKAKKRVVTLKRGKYVITVRDRATEHNFRLVGPGVNRSTQVRRLETKTWNVTLKPRTYTYLCDPHTSMRATFQVTP